MMGFVFKTPSGKWQANWREPSGQQRSKTLPTKKEANTFLAQVETSKARGGYVSPVGGKTRFSEHARAWMASWNYERTTVARDASIMRTHVLAKWGDWQLAKIDALSVQTWLTELRESLSRATVAECRRLTSGVLRSAVRNRLIAFNPCEDVTVPGRRVTDKDEQVITRRELRTQLLPAVPERYRALVATAGGTGMRWGELVGLCTDALDLDAGTVRVIRTVVEVAGHTSFKPFPKSRAGRRTVPLPSWVVTALREHLAAYPAEDGGLIFSNEAGGALRRTLFRSRIWRPALVRAGLLGEVRRDGERFEAIWTDESGNKHAEQFRTEAQAVTQVTRNQTGGFRFHDLRHSYGTWLADDGIPVNKVQKVMGHENVTTTLQLYVRKTEDPSAILNALDDDDPDDDGTAGLPVPAR